jgi:hypothetical protein
VAVVFESRHKESYSGERERQTGKPLMSRVSTLLTAWMMAVGSVRGGIKKKLI